MDGMRLLEMHPGIANLNCQFCLKYMVDEKTGRPEISSRTDGPEFRILNMGDEYLAPCRDLRLNANGRRIRSCPKGTPENSRTLSGENELCYEHFRECKAIGQFPDDSVVRRNAAVIQDVLDESARSREIEFQSTLITTVMRSVMR
jgi:hypothetical protein